MPEHNVPEEKPDHMALDDPEEDSQATQIADTQIADYDSEGENASPSAGEDEKEDGVQDAGQVASLLLTTHGEIHLDEARAPKEFQLTYEDGLDELVFISAVSVDSDSINYGVCQVQERGIQELVNTYVKNSWKPSTEQIIGPFKRVRNLDQYGRLQPPRKKARMGQYSDTLASMPASVHHSGAYETALAGAYAGEYDPTRYVIQSQAGKGWQGIVLRPGKGSVKFLDKTYLITKKESADPRQPSDNNALLFLPGGPPIMQMISNFRPQESDFYKGNASNPEPGELLQKPFDEFPSIPVKLDKGAISDNKCGNMIDDKAAEAYGIGYPGLAAITGETSEETEVSTTLECLVQNAVKAYRDRVGQQARLGTLVVLDLTCMVFKEEGDNPFGDADWGEDTPVARDKRATRREAAKIVRDLFKQEGAHLAPSLTKLEAELLSGNKLKRKRLGGGRRTRRRRKVSEKRKTRMGRTTHRGGKVRGQRKMRGQRKTRGKRKTRGQRKTRRHR